MNIAVIILIFISSCCAASLPNRNSKELGKFKRLDRLLRELIDKRQSDEHDTSVNNTDATSTPTPNDTADPIGLEDGATDSEGPKNDPSFDDNSPADDYGGGDDYYDEDYKNDDNYDNYRDDGRLVDNEHDYREKNAEYDDLALPDDLSEEYENVDDNDYDFSQFDDRDNYKDYDYDGTETEDDTHSDKRAHTKRQNNDDYNDEYDEDLDIIDSLKRHMHKQLRQKSSRRNVPRRSDETELTEYEAGDDNEDNFSDEFDSDDAFEHKIDDREAALGERRTLDKQTRKTIERNNLKLRSNVDRRDKSKGTGGTDGVNGNNNDDDSYYRDSDYGDYEDVEYDNYKDNDTDYLPDDKRTNDRHRYDSTDKIRMIKASIFNDKVSKKQLDNDEFENEDEIGNASDDDIDNEDEGTVDYESPSDRRMFNTRRKNARRLRSRLLERRMFERLLKRVIDDDKRSTGTVSASANIYGYNQLRDAFAFPGSRYLDELIQTEFIIKRNSTITLAGVESEWIPSSYIANLLSTMSAAIVCEDPAAAALYYTRKLTAKAFRNRMRCPSAVIDRLLIRLMHDSMTDSLLNKGAVTMVTSMTSNILILSEMPSNVADEISGFVATDLNKHFYTDSVTYMVSVGLADIAAFTQKVHRRLNKFFEDSKATPSNINQGAVYKLVKHALHGSKVHCKDKASFIADHAFAANTALQQFKLVGERNVADLLKSELYNNLFAAFLDPNAAAMTGYTKYLAKCDFTAVAKAVHHYGNEVVSRVANIWKQVEQNDVEAFKAMLRKVLAPGENLAVKTIMKAHGWPMT